jgi:NTE family protein
MKEPEIALVLGAGSARGLAHIGVLQVLEKNGVRPDLIVGCSMGAIIGAVYAAGTDLAILSKLVCQLEYRSLFDFHLPKKGFVVGKKLEELLQVLTKQKRFEDLQDIKFVAVATDLVTQQMVVLEAGLLTEAVRASSSVPGVFEPVYRENMVLVDGAIYDRLPVEVAQQRNAKVIIAVDVKSSENGGVEIRNTLDVMLTSLDILESRQFQPKKLKVDALILPNVYHFNPADFKKAEELIAEGRKAAEKAMPKLLGAIAKKLPQTARQA